MRNLGQRFTYANVASTLALFLAISGGGAAVAMTVGNNSVGSPQIIDGSIKTRDLGGSSVKTSKIANGTIKHRDLTAGAIGVARGYAWIHDGATTLNTPVTLTNSYVYNSAGGAVTVERTGTGEYWVEFAGLNFYPGNVQVTAYSSSVTWCKVQGWGSNGAGILCFDAAGAAANSTFSLAVIE